MKKVIILGNGPSLRGFDFKRLSNVSTVGLNAAYRYWDKINWYPTYYACCDTALIQTHHAHIKRLLVENKVKKIFTRANFLDYHPELKTDQRVIIWDDCVKEQDAIGYIAFKSSFPEIITTGSHAIRFAAHLGYQSIVLLGIDLKYTEFIREAKKGDGLQLEIRKTPKRNPNYFFDEYQQKGDIYHVPNPKSFLNGRVHLETFRVLRTDFISNQLNISIVNANKNSLLYDLSIFDYVPIDAILLDENVALPSLSFQKIINLKLKNEDKILELNQLLEEKNRSLTSKVFEKINLAIRNYSTEIRESFHYSKSKFLRYIKSL